jgi:NAD(P)-dependent dehydrogenase (short-subunit alcohol dehydrogenase family)
LSKGGADGFGSAIVDRYSAEGWKVIIIDLHPGRGEAKAAADSNVDFVCGDVTLRDTWEKALAVANGYGRIDLVVNNAGIGHDPRVSPYFSLCTLRFSSRWN